MTNPAPASFKQLIKSGAIKRADAMKIPYKDLHIEPGFNERDRTEDFDQSVRELADYILSGGTYPPLECRVADDGKVFVVDGHRRHEAIGLAIKAGAPIEWVDIRQFVGNDADRVARIVTSAQGRPLSPLETSRVYKRLQGFGLSPADIAKKVSRSLQHVNELLTLANANTDVQKHVSEGAVSAKNAAALVRQHGERAGAVLDGKLAEAKAQGKAKVTAKSLAPRSTPTQEAPAAPPAAPATPAAPVVAQAPAPAPAPAPSGMPPEPSDNMVAAGVRAVRNFQRSDECRVMAEQEAVAAGVRAAYSAMYREFTETGS
ncbi:ParB/RepB/Spo0J family partition protein [Orrella dioscoreae]|uniref:Predicted transcriptional regulators n=1 Tax=Orrella dioscoreae TaxID=1851544 RepID=A0A1C3K881_9BURK|nr:ParB N-terminal domain-containing protein [Orrella dioscoreae]SBT27567.1 Predicted transcriptional regulators [Orrella dioscoreae]SOE48062.1 Predicted transcriptional regulators [Orrella dioscoreae]